MPQASPAYPHRSMYRASPPRRWGCVTQPAPGLTWHPDCTMESIMTAATYTFDADTDTEINDILQEITGDDDD